MIDQVASATISFPAALNMLDEDVIFVPLGSEHPLIATVDTVISESLGVKSKV